MTIPRFDYEEAKRLRAEGWKAASLALRYGVDVSRIYQVTKSPRSGKRTEPTPRQKLAADLYEDGLSAPEIADKLCISLGSAYRLLRACGTNLGTAHEPPPPVPAWVPQHLRKTYVVIGTRRGEEAAASHCRRLKREAAAECR